MYSAEFYNPDDSGLIKHADLPDVIQTNDDTWNKYSTPIIFADGFAARAYELVSRDDDEEDIIWSAVGDFPAWDFVTSGLGQGPCLIDGVFLRDDFADTYLLTALGESVEVARQSLCLWTGTDSCGFVWQLSYGFQGLIQAGPAQEYAWNIIASENQEDCSAPDYSLGTKSGFQNTPVGSYGGNVDATVSE